MQEQTICQTISIYFTYISFGLFSIFLLFIWFELYKKNKIYKIIFGCIKICIVLFIIFLFFITFKHIFEEPVPIFNVDSISIIQPDISINISKRDIATHNSILLNNCQQNLSYNNNFIISKENTKTQTRNFYIVLFVAMITLIFSKNYNSKNSDLKKRNIIILFVIIIMMWFLDVQYSDKINSLNTDKKIMGNTIRFLVNLKPDDLIWYNLKLPDSLIIKNDNIFWAEFKKPDSLKIKKDEEKKLCKRISRKIKLFLRPSIDQLFLYIFPFAVLYVYTGIMVYKKMENKARHEKKYKSFLYFFWISL